MPIAPDILIADAVAALPDAVRAVAEADDVGVVIADTRNVVAANGYFRRLVGTSEDGRSIPWVRLTPAESLTRSAHGIAAARVSGVSEPYAKEYDVAGGGRVSVLAVVGLLADEPLPLLGLVAAAGDARARDAVQAWASAPDRDVRPRLGRADWTVAAP